MAVFENLKGRTYIFPLFLGPFESYNMRGQQNKLAIAAKKHQFESF
jgi:hypothetical protein